MITLVDSVTFGWLRWFVVLRCLNFYVTVLYVYVTVRYFTLVLTVWLVLGFCYRILRCVTTFTVTFVGCTLITLRLPLRYYTFTFVITFTTFRILPHVAFALPVTFPGYTVTRIHTHVYFTLVDSPHVPVLLVLRSLVRLRSLRWLIRSRSLFVHVGWLRSPRFVVTLVTFVG